MASRKITELTAASAVSSDDLLVVVDDPAGTPTSKKATVAQVIAAGVASASESAAGVVELATTAETETGASTTLVPPVSATEATYVKKSLVDAKGDLIVATADNTPARLAVGADGSVFVADSAASPGAKWLERHLRPVAGQFYSPGSLSNNLTGAWNATGVAYGHPFVWQGGSIDALSVYFTGTGDQVWRLSLHQHNAASVIPGAVVADAGQVTLSGGAAEKTATFASTAVAPGLYWCVILVETHTTQAQVSCLYYNSPQIVQGLPDNGGIANYVQGKHWTGVATGAAPTGLGTGSWATVVPKVRVRAA